MSAALDYSATAEKPVATTLFFSHSATRKTERQYTLPQLRAEILAAKANAKSDLPWLKLARFGEAKTQKGSLRHDANVLAISGVEADYDSEAMPPTEAFERLEKAGVAALIYTSPSHTEDAPRWRVLCPTSTELPPERREHLVGRLNGLLGGILAGESFTLSQAYYFGRVGANPSHMAEIVEGEPIDLCDHLDAAWTGRPASKASSAGPTGPRQGKADVAALYADIVTGAGYHVACVRLAGVWARGGVPYLEARDRLQQAFEAIPEAERDARWTARRADVDRCLEDIYGKEAKQKDSGARIPRKSGSEDPPEEKKRQELRVLDPRGWTQKAPAREWIVQDWLPRGVVTGLYGDGGVGKSLLAMMLLASTALALPWLGLQAWGGRVLGVFCEDDDEELQRRQEAINEALGVEMCHLENLRLISRVGEDNALITFDGQDVGTTTAFYDQIRDYIADCRPGLVVLDTAADLYPGNENDRSKVRQFVGAVLGKLAREFNCAIVLCAHPSLTGMSSGTGSSGSTAWNNTMRSRWYLTRPAEEDASVSDRVLTRVKANYAPREAAIECTWHQGVFQLRNATRASTVIQMPTIEALFDEIEKAWNEGRAWSYRVETRKGGRYFPRWAKQHHGIPEDRLQSLIGDWIMNGFLAFETFDYRNKTRGLKVVRRLSA